ncbi:alkylation response protein AidB-like acyl-CoA dehydrogenase [Kitasatospora sp. GAS204A]|uniref:acyl-CoA dehydrogenase family protein n=1 Tax=unclassified Kitasatospora TaxID=2633591 RepID=UPI002473D4F3|nr:acyl-CoA dehydrogenase family protein [Kitasatospora sp. GAS204B]MDH6121829.1 alkylation response protein AidB-like acyl-CoA dehydrogenase [Kitasatospora sp. GAS204B]
MNLLYSEIEEELRASVRDLLHDRSPLDAVLARISAGQGYDPALWRALTQIGVTELTQAGGTLREVAVVMEELGYSLAPTPFLGSVLLAGTGERIGTLAVPFSFSGGAATVQETGGRLTGTVTSVADALSAELLVVPVDGGALWQVESGFTVTPRTSLDLTRPLADVVLHDAPGRLVTEDPAALAHILLTGAGLLASEQLGVAQWCLDTTVAYLKERRQFNRPVGSFQALKHRLADLWLEVVGARAAARAAADALASEAADAELLVAVAASHCGTVAVRAAEECVQLHGGIGMTWEHPAHLFLKRAKADQLALGTPGRHRARLAQLVDLPA